jgi:hypothetical protein
VRGAVCGGLGQLLGQSLGSRFGCALRIGGFGALEQVFDLEVELCHFFFQPLRG